MRLRRGAGSPNGEFGHRGDGFLSQIIGDGNFQFVLSRRKRAESDYVLEREFLTVLGQLVIAKVKLEHGVSVFVFRHAILHGGVGLVRFVVHFQIVDLQENAHAIVGV